jgi:hypothetical protein
MRKTSLASKGETWKCIPGYPKYIASNLGNIMKLPEYTPYNSGKVNTKGRHGYILSPRAIVHGHLQVNLENEIGKRSFQYVHRLIAMAFLKSRRGCNVVCHKDDNPANNNVTNLFWGTQYINMNMVSNRKPVFHKRNRDELQKLITECYTRNAQNFNGSIRKLFEFIAKELGYSVGHVTAIYYAKDNQYKVLISKKDLVDSK